MRTLLPPPRRTRRAWPVRWGSGTKQWISPPFSAAKLWTILFRNIKAGVRQIHASACNRKIKFGRFLELADEWGADFIATGHYARISLDSQSGAYCLYASEARGKDQSYFLYTMTQRELARTLMPLSGMDKDKTRALARSLGLPVAEKPDSQDVCFIPDGDYIRFLEEYAGYQGQKGPFRSIDGEILGWHKGIAHYTIGQRKGLGTAFGKPCL